MSHRGGELRRNPQFGVEEWRPLYVVRILSAIGGLAFLVLGATFLVLRDDEAWWFFGTFGVLLGLYLLHKALFARIAIEGAHLIVFGVFSVVRVELRLVGRCDADFYGITVDYRGGSAESRIASRFIAWWTTRADDICVEIMRRADEARRGA